MKAVLEFGRSGFKLRGHGEDDGKGSGTNEKAVGLEGIPALLGGWGSP